MDWTWNGRWCFYSAVALDCEPDSCRPRQYVQQPRADVVSFVQQSPTNAGRACSDASPHASTYSRSPPLHARIPSSRVCSWAIGLREFRQNSWGSCLCSSLCRCRSARASAGTSACAWCRLGQQAPTGLGWAAGAAACMRPPAFCLTVPRGTLAR